MSHNQEKSFRLRSIGIQLCREGKPPPFLSNTSFDPQVVPAFICINQDEQSRTLAVLLQFSLIKQYKFSPIHCGAPRALHLTVTYRSSYLVFPKFTNFWKVVKTFLLKINSFLGIKYLGLSSWHLLVWRLYYMILIFSQYCECVFHFLIEKIFYQLISFNWGLTLCLRKLCKKQIASIYEM